MLARIANREDPDQAGSCTFCQLGFKAFWHATSVQNFSTFI